MLIKFEKRAFLSAQLSRSSLEGERAEESAEEREKIIRGGEYVVEGTRVALRSGSGEDKASPCS